MYSGHVLVAQRKKMSSGARGKRPLKRCIYARTARRHEEEVSEDKPASDRYKAGIANDRQMVLWTFAVSGALGVSCGACFEALASLYASAGACTVTTYIRQRRNAAGK